jgi:hypothetical protein
LQARNALQLNVIGSTKHAECPYRVRRESDAGSDFSQFRRLFVQMHINSDSAESDRGSESPNSTANHDHSHEVMISRFPVQFENDSSVTA